MDATVDDPAEQGQRPVQQGQRAAPPPPPETRRARLRWPLMIAGIVIAVLGGVAYYLFTGRYMSTDDSALMAAQTTISSNIPGRVVELDVHDNQPVRRGQVLFRLDDRPLRIALAEAQAKLSTTQLQIRAAEASYRHELANLTAARDTVAYQQREYARQQRLVQSGISSRAQFEQAQHALQLAQSQLVSAQQQAISYLALLGGNPNMKVADHPVVMEAQAALERAQLQLSYSTIHAPEDGVVTKVEQLQVGDYINAATPVFSLISTTDVWVEANFKEDQLAHMRPGQPAQITIDAFPGRRFQARVASLSPGTGAQFSLLPPENATGNWVKVVQRVPVRLSLSPDSISELPIDGSLSGLSADVTVDTGYRRKLVAYLFGGGERAPAHVPAPARAQASAGSEQLTRR